ncbi:hypothetical protein RHMOL_Rhmol07G0052300 [Rhododendron molle]|uniref:Uncharacterized protein n=1 Tax=Rhododendron molle TaxID=49168 RepID=A0ACC0MZ96_RHOML|nr:hypothetical protein RHMOL_Rhmol07G0052300 [Rhododendron molle]
MLRLGLVPPLKDQLVWYARVRTRRKEMGRELNLSLVWKGNKAREGERQRETKTPPKPSSVSLQKWRDSVRKGSVWSTPRWIITSGCAWPEKRERESTRFAGEERERVSACWRVAGKRPVA